MPFNLVRYSQQDPLWKNNKIGDGPDTIGYVGCALTCLAMYSSGWGLTETPATLNLKLRASGGFKGEAIVWSAITKFHPELRNTGLTLCMNTAAPLDEIDSALAAGNPVIVEVDFSPAAGLQTHWVLIYAKQADDYLIQDPWPSPPETQPVTLMGRFAQGKPLQRAIKAVAWYEHGSPSSPTPSTPLPPPIATDLVLDVRPTATAGIKLHIAASGDSIANYAEMPGMQLDVIEDKAGALAKLGQFNQWIYVRDPNGHQGYVSAAYVQIASAGSSTTPEPVPASTPPAEPAPSVPDSTPPASAPQRMQVVVIQSVGTRGLAIRQQPSPGAEKVNNESAGARLTVLEPSDTAIPKIGKVGQWLAVKATNNRRGYVMAQYVRLKQ
jgi:hypothetical protein